MPHNKNNLNDLNYLATLGFEKTKVSEDDINELRIKIKTKTFSYNNGLYFSFISLIIGIFIGVSCFFAMYNQPKNFASKTQVFIKDTIDNQTKINPKTIVLDTIKIEKENFIYPRKQQLIDTTTISFDNILNTTLEPITLNTLPIETKATTQLKYIPNAAIIYLHDLKITNYTLLYFNKNQNIKLNLNQGTSALYANKVEGSNSSLKQESNFYLHEAIAEAMLYYKKLNYNQCIILLNTVSQYSIDDINCNFYYGMCYYNKKNYSLAKNYFENCISNSNNTFLQEAQYYKALCLVELGETDQAKFLLKQIIDDAQFYSQKAFNTLSRL